MDSAAHGLGIASQVRLCPATRSCWGSAERDFYGPKVAGGLLLVEEEPEPEDLARLNPSSEEFRHCSGWKALGLLWYHLALL